MDLSVIALAALATIGRVLALIVLSIVVGWMLGYLAIKSRRFENIYIAIVNILESIPVLAFLPIVLLAFISGLGGSLGVEVAADFLVFDAIVWNIWIGIYQAFKTVPGHMLEVADNYNLGVWGKFRNVYIPFSIPRVSSDIFPSFADALFYVMVSEVFAVGVTTFHVFGIGSLIVQATAQTDINTVLECLAVLAIGVVGITIWFNNLSHSAIAKYGVNTAEEIKRPHWRLRLGRWQVGRRPGLPVYRYSLRQLRPALPGFHFTILHRRNNPRLDNAVKYSGIALAGAIGLIIAYKSVMLLLAVTPAQWNSYFDQTPAILYGMGVDYLRVFIVTGISFVVAMFLGYFLAVHHRAGIISLPVIQSLSAFPAPAYFPLVFAAIAPFLMHAIPAATAELLVLFLCFVSTFYYVFFGFWVGVKSIPTEFWEIMQNYNMGFFAKMRRIIIPAILPYLVTGLSSTINSAWGGLAVGEYWPHIHGNQSLQVNTGMMKIISLNLASGDTGLAAWTSLLFAIVVGVYSIVFTRNLMDLARKKYVIEEGIYQA